VHSSKPHTVYSKEGLPQIWQLSSSAQQDLEMRLCSEMLEQNFPFYICEASTVIIQRMSTNGNQNSD